MARGRATRGGGEKKVVKKKKAAPKKKSAKKIKSDDDSEVDGSDAPPKRKAGGGFQKPFMLSPALSELTGETQVRQPPPSLPSIHHSKPALGDLIFIFTDHVLTRVCLAFETRCGQESMGTYKGQQPPGSQGQATNSVRRKDASDI